jgi:hypothetical protein
VELERKKGREVCGGWTRGSVGRCGVDGSKWRWGVGLFRGRLKLSNLKGREDLQWGVLSGITWPDHPRV